MEFRIQIINDVLKFKIACPDPEQLSQGFYEALSDKKMDDEDRQLLLLCITDAIIKVIEERKDYEVAHFTLEKFIKIYNSSSTQS